METVEEFTKSYNKYIANSISGTFIVDENFTQIVDHNMSKYTASERQNDGSYVIKLNQSLTSQKAKILVGLHSD